MSKKRYEAKIFLDKKQKEHFKKFGVYADVNSKIAEWMQEYADIEVKKLSIPVVSDTLILTPKDAEVFFNEIMNPKDANEALKKAMLKFITR